MCVKRTVLVKHLVRLAPWTAVRGRATTVPMPRIKRGPNRQLRRHFIKEWRDYRRLTQEQAAERIGVDRTTLGRIESRQIAYTQPILEALADAYRCEPWDLLNRDPSKEGAVIDISEMLRGAEPSELREILGYARGVLRK